MLDTITKTVYKLQRDAIFPYQTLQPTLAVIHKSANSDSGAASYLRSIKKTAAGYGVDVLSIEADTPFVVVDEIKRVASIQKVHGIIIISNYGDINRVLYDRIPVSLDLDSLSTLSLGKLIDNRSPIAYRGAPCTAVACMKIIETLNGGEDFSGKNCLVIGRSIRVGRPLAEILMQKNMTVTVAHTATDMSKLATQEWDYIVSAAGKPKVWNKDNPLPLPRDKRSLVIDVGMNVDENGELCGDVDRDWFNDAANEGSYITPVTSGVGKVTTTVLFSKLFANTAQYFMNSAGVYHNPTFKQGEDL